MTYVALLGAFGIMISACQPENKPADGESQEYKDLTHTAFVESEEVFPNPERGYYFVDDFYTPTDAPINANSLKVNRKMNRTSLILWRPTV